MTKLECTNNGVGGGQGEQLPGSGGALDSCPQVNWKPEKKIPITRRCRKGDHTQGGRIRYTYTWRHPRGLNQEGTTGTWVQGEGENGGRTDVITTTGSGTQSRA